MQRRDDYEAIRRSFDGDQLRVARELRCLTQTELAKKSSEAGKGRGVTAAAISQFEGGTSVPASATIEVFVSVLDIDPEFLTDRAADPESHRPAFFRSLRSTPAKERKRARNIAQLLHRLTLVLKEHVELPHRNIPSIPGDPFAEIDERRLVAEAAAAEVRRAWHMSAGPVDDVLGTIEKHGVVCARLRFNEERVDAFSVAFSDYPVAVLAADKDKWDRSRFDAAHELGHIVMHGDATGVPEAERQANEFAAAFLMPADDIRAELPSRADWQHLLELKNEWGASVASLLYRCRTLEVMTEKTYIGASKVMAARGWKRHEPQNRPAESPRLLADAITQAGLSGTTPQRLRKESAIPRDLFEEVHEVIAP